MTKSAVILLSGGLDSVVSLAAALKQGVDVKLALTFNYGQKAFENELAAAKKIAEYYNIPHKIIELDWLKNITDTSLVSECNIPDVEESELDNTTVTTNSMKSVWVPNRNGLFVNIAASFCDSLSYDYIVIGANKEEAVTFSDNSQEFIDNINKSLTLSTNYDVAVLAPLITENKMEIVKLGIELKVPLNLINSCYNSGQGHCGRCESCVRLKRALEDSGQFDLIEQLFN